MPGAFFLSDLSLLARMPLHRLKAGSILREELLCCGPYTNDSYFLFFAALHWSWAWDWPLSGLKKRSGLTRT
jgi:hypothetical protein